MWLSLWNQTASAHSLIQGSSFHDAFNQRSLSHGVVKNYKLQQLQESFSTKKSKLLAVYTRKKRKKESTNAGALAWAAALREKLRWGACALGWASCRCWGPEPDLLWVGSVSSGGPRIGASRRIIWAGLGQNMVAGRGPVAYSTKKDIASSKIGLHFFALQNGRKTCSFMHNSNVGTHRVILIHQTTTDYTQHM
jgi:hypothetical protein